MCGIVGAVSKDKNIIPILITGLKNLEYRGYDSAGVAFFNKNKINVIKEVGKVEKLIKKLDKSNQSTIGIAHTRWATHGNVSTINAHPHKVGHITLVHNGIIENSEEIKSMLIKNNYKFKSTTDSEIGCALLDYYYQKYQDVDRCIKEFMKKVIGSYAILFIIDNDFNNIYCLKKESPLIIAKDNNTNIIVSDIRAVLKYTNKYYLLNDLEYAKVSSNEIIIKDINGTTINKEINTYLEENEENTKGLYEHFMLKEIMDQKETITNTIFPYIENGISSLLKLPDLTKYKEINIIGCGTSYHAGLVGKYLFENYANTRCNVYLASEYRYQNNFYDKDTLTIFISQSGETADSYSSLKMLKEKNLETLGIINVVNSSISLLVDTCLYTSTGCEIAVASTKAYTAQVAMLSLLVLSLVKRKSLMSDDEISKVIDEYKNINKYIDPLLDKKDVYKRIAKEIYKDNDIFYIGRGLDYALSMEGALKLKEISYIHSESYPAGELKHGTISLIKKNSKVISSVTNDMLRPKTISNLKEVIARGAKCYLITNSNVFEDNIDVIKIKRVSDFLNPILVIIPYQLIAYYTAYLKGTDIDKPKNLAKSVTVE